MPVTNYHTVNGRLIGETTDGVRTDYLTDALGSVTATVDQSQNVLNTYRYKPYGGLLAKTGASADPRFLWAGDTGSRTTGLNCAEQYNRARHYGAQQAAWTSVDPLWPRLPAYEYSLSNPATHTDGSGLECNLTIRQIMHYPLSPIGGIVAPERYCNECQSGWCWCRGSVEHVQTVHGWVTSNPSLPGTPCQYRHELRNIERVDPPLEDTCPGNCRCRTNVPHCNVVAGHSSYSVTLSVTAIWHTLTLNGRVWVSHKNDLDLLECG